MSWDVSLYKFNRQYKTLGEIPANEQPQLLGSRKEVQAIVNSVFAGTSWNEQDWGIFDAEFGSVEFNLGKEDPVVSIALHVRASEEVIGGILQLCKRMSCQAIDLTNSSFLDQSAHPEVGLQKWQEYRNKIVGDHEA